VFQFRILCLLTTGSIGRMMEAPREANWTSRLGSGGSQEELRRSTANLTIPFGRVWFLAATSWNTG